MTTLLDSTQLATIASAISALINNGNAPVNTANAIEALRDALLTAETALDGGDTSALDAAMAAVQDSITTMSASIASLNDADASTASWIDTVNGLIAALQTDDTANAAAIATEHGTNVSQGTAITAIQAVDTAQASAITAIQGVDAAQATSITAIQSKDTTQDGQISAIQTKDTAQDSAIAALQAAVNLVSNVPAAPARSLNTAFQISTTRPADVSYSIPITAVAALVAGQRGKAYLKYADNSAMTTNPVTVSQDDFGIGSGLVVTGYAALKLVGRIPAGKWVSLVSENTTGTPTFGTVSAQETVL